MKNPIFQSRSSAVAGPPVRSIEVRAASLDEGSRSFEATVASEHPALMIDFRTGQLIDEILIAEGGTFPESVPLLDSHQRDTTSDVIGSMNRFRRETVLWVGFGRIASSDPRADSVWGKIRDGHLNSFSIGYRILEFENVSPGTTKAISGRQFKNESDRTLRVVTRWEVHEVSLVAVPADSNAKIRSAVQPMNGRSNSMPLPTPAIHSRDSVTGQPTIGALVSGMMLRNGINDPSRCRVSLEHNRLIRLSSCQQFERDADEGQARSTNHILDVVRCAAALDGVNIDAGSGRQGVVYQLWQQYIQGRAGYSTSNLAQLFTQVFGALFLNGWESEYDSTAGWTSESDNLTLKETPRVRPSAMAPLEKRGRGGSAQHVDFETPSEDTKLAEYSGLFNIDEVDLINNNFGNFEQLMPQQMGVAAKRLRPDLVYSEMLANAVMRDGTALFHADHANLKTNSPLSETTLSDAQAMVGKQAEGGVPLNLRGRYIIVPEKLARVAAQLARAVELNDGESTPPPVVRSDSRLDNGVVDPATGTVHAGSDSTWFVSAAGNNHTIEVQYLQGTGRQPRIRFGFLEQGEFGVWLDVEHFVAAKAIDWRGMVKSTG